MNRNPHFQPGDTVLRYFRLDERLVTDPTGATLWKSRHTARNEDVSLLILPPELFHLTRAHEKIAAAIRELKPFANAGFIRVTDFHFGGSEAAVELEAIEGAAVPLSDRVEEGLSMDDSAFRTLFDGISAPMEKLHHRGVPWGRLTPWQVLDADGQVQLLPPRILQIFEEELLAANPGHAAKETLAPFRPPESDLTLAGDLFSVCAVLRKAAGDRSSQSDSLDQILGAPPAGRPKDVFALRTQLFSGKAKTSPLPAPSPSDSTDVPSTESPSSEAPPAVSTVLENPALLKIAAIGTAAVIVLILGFSLLTGGNNGNDPDSGEFGDPDDEFGPYTAEDFAWIDQQGEPAEEEATPPTEDPGPEINGGILIADNSREENPPIEEPGVVQDVPTDDPAVPGQADEETAIVEPGISTTPGTGDREAPGEREPSIPADGGNEIAATEDTPPLETEPVRPSNSGATEGGEIAALPAAAETGDGDSTPRLKPPVEPASPPSANRIPPPPAPEPLTRSPQGIEIVAPTRPEGQERVTVYGHSRTPVTVNQWRSFKAATKGPESDAGKSEARESDGDDDIPFAQVSKKDAAKFAGWLTESDRKAEVITSKQAYRLPRSAETRNEAIWREEDTPAAPAESRRFGLVLADAEDKPVPPQERKTREFPVKINPQGIPVKVVPEGESAIGRQGKPDTPLWKRPGS